MNRKPWELKLNEYVGVAHIVPGHPTIEANGPGYLERMRDAMETWPAVEVASRPDLVFRISDRGGIAVQDAKTGDLIAGHTTFFPYVLPEHRGRNINAEMNLLIDNMGMRAGVSSYTSRGFGSRVATHRLHVERALLQGHAVPPEVLQDYRVTDGRLRLRSPYTQDAHNAWSMAQASEMRAAHFAQITGGYEEVFATADDLNRGDFLDYGPDDQGYFLAIALHREIGAGFLIHVQGSRCLVQAEIDDLVIDCDGIRPAVEAMDDLIRRRYLHEGANQDPFLGKIDASPIMIYRLQAEEDLLACIDPDRHGPAPSGAPNLAPAALPAFSEASIEEALESLPGQRMMRSALVSREPALAV